MADPSTAATKRKKQHGSYMTFDSNVPKVLLQLIEKNLQSDPQFEQDVCAKKWCTLMETCQSLDELKSDVAAKCVYTQHHRLYYNTPLVYQKTMNQEAIDFFHNDKVIIFVYLDMTYKADQDLIHLENLMVNLKKVLHSAKVIVFEKKRLDDMTKPSAVDNTKSKLEQNNTIVMKCKKALENMIPFFYCYYQLWTKDSMDDDVIVQFLKKYIILYITNGTSSERTNQKMVYCIQHADNMAVCLATEHHKDKTLLHDNIYHRQNTYIVNMNYCTNTHLNKPFDDCRKPKDKYAFAAASVANDFINVKSYMDFMSSIGITFDII